jgi:hypothetical protein
MADRPIEICENCKVPIGKLETAHVWQNHVVCETCQQWLARKGNNISNEQIKASASKNDAFMGSLGLTSRERDFVLKHGSRLFLDIANKLADEFDRGNKLRAVSVVAALGSAVIFAEDWALDEDKRRD